MKSSVSARVSARRFSEASWAILSASQSIDSAEVVRTGLGEAFGGLATELVHPLSELVAGERYRALVEQLVDATGKERHVHAGFVASLEDDIDEAE